ncbi:AAA family ATPase [Paenarthrobacter ureafaciens]|uniref:AAA family ATPase n=1 Tax=Paenarthrobacter ureafaciens TaxID=37931 RepID=UPI003CF58A52
MTEQNPPALTPAEADEAYARYLDAERRIYSHLEMMRDRAEATRRFKAEQAAIELPQASTLTDFLAIPDEDVLWRIDNLMAVGARVVLAAQYKAGKTTFIGNVIRVLADGGELLGRYQANPVLRIGVVDNELDERTMRQWLRAQGIVNQDRVLIVPIRGKVSTFNIMDDNTRQQWAGLLRGCDIIILDCLRPVLDALGLDENKDAGRFLVSFDALLKECGASEAVIVHHMGHSGERSRGDSRILDWPDATWKLVRESPDNPDSLRYFSAFGRDVNEPESLIQYDATTRKLTAATGNRTTSRVANLIDDVIQFVSLNPGVSKTGIRDALPGDNKDLSNAVDKAVSDGALIAEKRIGRGGGTAYRAAPQRIAEATPSNQQQLPAA